MLQFRPVTPTVHAALLLLLLLLLATPEPQRAEQMNSNVLLYAFSVYCAISYAPNPKHSASSQLGQIS